MNNLPECCTCTPDAERAETLYCAYQYGGSNELAGLAWDGKPCPTWAQLLERAEKGEPGANGIVAKWRAVAENVEKGMAAMAENGLIQAIASAEPASRMFHVKQSGFQDLGKMLGYIDSLGNFHADNGALYGCIYSAVPVEPPKPKSTDDLPKLEAGACVARRVRVEIVIGDITEDDIPF